MKSVAAIAAVLCFRVRLLALRSRSNVPSRAITRARWMRTGSRSARSWRWTLSSQVGVVLDDLPAAKRADVAQWLLSQGTDYWKARAIRQITLAYYRLNFRNYYVSNQGALPLPDPSLWTFSFGTARRAPGCRGRRVRRRCRVRRLPYAKRDPDRLQLAERFDGQPAQQARRHGDDAVRIAPRSVALAPTERVARVTTSTAIRGARSIQAARPGTTTTTAVPRRMRSRWVAPPSRATTATVASHGRRSTASTRLP